MSVYYVLAPDLGLLKIGFAADPKARFSKIQSDSPTRLVLLGFEEGDESAEAARHKQFAAVRHRGEWFRVEGDLAAHVQTLAPLPPKPVSLNKQLTELGISKAYASMILSGKMHPPLELAIHIFLKIGWKHERIACLTDEQIAMIAPVCEWRPRKGIAA